MLKIMDSIRMKSDFLVNNCYLILWSDLLLFSFKSDFCENERSDSFEGSVLWHSREILDFYKFVIIWKKRNLNVMQINVSSESYVYFWFKINITENLLLPNKALVHLKGPYFALFYKNK